MMDLKQNLIDYILDSRDATNCFTLGLKYENLGHTAPAIGFFIRTAEFSDKKIFSYEALLRTSLCINKQGSRPYVIKSILQRAISLMPERPEAYFLLSRLHEKNKEWHESYVWATIGETFFKDKDISENLSTDVDYPGYYGFLFEKAVSSWWIGLNKESMYLFNSLNNRTDMKSQYINSVKDNLKRLYGTYIYDK